MKKSTLSLLVAGAMAAGGIAQAETFDSPQKAGEASTMTMGAPNQLTTNSPYEDNSLRYDYSLLPSRDDGQSIDTTVLGAGPAPTTVTTTTVMGPERFVYVQPNINWDPATARTQMRDHRAYMTHHYGDRHAAATFNVPTRAGEASTMTGGAPNMVTSNDRYVVGSYQIPYSAIGDSYYVFSY